jgi:hypothetical protein
METLAVIIMITLFIILMAFVFSSALLTPLIGKKNLLFVLLLGFVVGIIGGAFFIAPVFNDIPGMARSFNEFASNSPEIIVANISADNNVTQSIDNIRKIQGVKTVETQKIILNTTPMSESWKNSILSRAKTASANITSIEAVGNETLIIQIKPGSDPPATISNLNDWIELVSGVRIQYSIVQINMTVEASQVDDVIKKLPSQQAIVDKVSGPMEENVEYIEKILPNTFSLIMFCGLIGLLTGLAGIFIDRIIQFWKDVRKRVKK